MPNLGTRTPQYCHHRATGRAFVTLDGREFYLGPYGSKASRLEYDRLIAEWLAAGRRMPGKVADLTIAEVIIAYWRHAQVYYRKPDGTPTSEQDAIKMAVRPLKQLYKDTIAADFGPLRLEAVRQKMIELGWVRTQINRAVDRIRRMFKWAASKEMIPGSTYESLRCVTGLQAGRSEAVESDPVRPVAMELVTAIFPHVAPQIKAMIELQEVTGMRPGEVCAMRGCDLDTTGSLWTYKPATHKTQHHGHERVIYLGPRAREIVKPFLKPDMTAHLFSPVDAAQWHRERKHRKRRTPLSYGNAPGSNRRRKPQRVPGSQYDVGSYRRAIERGCDAAFPPPGDLARQKVKGKKGTRSETPAEWKARIGDRSGELEKWLNDHRWHPHQLRHTAATRLRREYGIEAAQVILGHKTLSVTELYAEKNVAAAQKVMAEAG